MTCIAYVNGAYTPLQDAAIHIEDRGYQFADGVYEAIFIHNGQLIDAEAHYERLERCLSELRIKEPMSRRALELVVKQTVRKNRLRHGMIYLQITRGVARRDHAFPDGVSPSLIIIARRVNLPSPEIVATGIKVISIPDIRWKRVDIKSISLLPNVLAKQKAREEGAVEAWQIDPDGNVTEGASSNAWIVTKDDVIVTRAPGNAILNGVTRQALVRMAKEKGYKIEERPFTISEAKEAAEAFISSTFSFAMPVVAIDGLMIGNGKPGPITLSLRALYWEFVTSQSGDSSL